MAISNKLTTVASGVKDIRTALKEIDSNFGARHISTLDDEIRQIGSNSAFVLYKDSEGNYKTMHVPISGNTLPDIRSNVPGDIITVLLPESITTLAGGCFQDCTTLEYINTENITQFGQHRCLTNTGISSLRLGKQSGTKILSVGCFQSCTKLKEVYYLNENYGVSSANYTFANNTALEKVYIASMRGWLLNTWGNSESSNPLYYAQHLYNLDGTEITEINIPDSITSINAFTFYGWNLLTEINIPNSVTSIANNSFGKCYGLTNVVVNGSAGNIGAFKNSGAKDSVMTIKGNANGVANGYFAFATIVIEGDFNAVNDTTQQFGRETRVGTYDFVLRIGGNASFNSSPQEIYNQNLVFFEVMGDVTNTGGYLYSNAKSGCIFHLGYSAKVTSPASYFKVNSSNISKIYVGNGSSQAADQAVLDQYLADSDWAQYSSKLDLWYNYTGEYKN